ncbi:MAG: MarR family transcriptional regulator, partial [Rhodoferax sp.]|nr:MarR family transcriptional regulator [Rhodoferax sp.]
DVTLTEEGQRLIDRAMPEINQLFADAQAGVRSEDMAVFWQVAHQLEKNLSSLMVDGTVLD